MTQKPTFILVLLSIAAAVGSAQSSTWNTRISETWTDPSSGLMWAAKDNGKDVSWHQAMEYCSKLRLDGHSDWELATYDELLGIYKQNTKALGENQQPKKHLIEPFTWDIKGNIYLTGDQWSSSLVNDDRGFHPEFAWFLSFNEGRRLYDELSFSYTRRALCVRRPASTSLPTSTNAAPSSSAQEASEETLKRGYWIDPTTNLMWAAKDNFKDVSRKKAMKYCTDLRIGGYSDWRLANIGELDAIYDKSAESPGVNPRSKWHGAEFMAWHVKGNLFLAGDMWSSTLIYDDRGKDTGWGWRYDFNEGREFNGDEAWFGHHALCVRDSTK